VAQAAKEFEPDVVVVDLQVGSMGGMAVARMLREAEFLNEIAAAPIVLLLDRAADAFIAGRSAADAWLVKPFTPQELRAALATATEASLSGGRTG
jgi:DNA-binding response OmpR family regulator